MPLSLQNKKIIISAGASGIGWATAKICLSRGAIGISGQVNLGDSAEPEMILRMSNITSEALEAELPVLGMFYPRGPNLRHDPSDSTMGVAHAARLAWELGCNVVKVPWTGSEESFRTVTSSVPIPVLISGGEREACLLYTSDAADE